MVDGNRLLLLTTVALSCTWPCSAEDFVPLARITDPRLDESSGIAISRNHTDSLWLHNDSGDTPRIFLVEDNGRTKASVTIHNAQAVDWEDMCSFEVDGQPWLLIADVGDNDSQRSRQRSPCTLYLLPEPQLSDQQSQLSVPAKIRIQVEYEDGPHNCESVAVDVARKEILLLTKSQPLDCHLYKLPLDLDTARQTQQATRVTSALIPFATAMDLSADGQQLVVATMWTGILVTREPDQTWAEAFAASSRPVLLPPRRQGESVCFDREGQFLYLNSEFRNQPLWKIAADRGL